jgi:hypothetical protein
MENRLREPPEVKKILYIFLLIVSTISTVAQESNQTWISRPELYQSVSAGEDTFFLPYPYILPGSVRVSFDTVKIDTAQYVVDNIRGRIRFLSPPDSGTVVQITFRTLPIGLPIISRHWTAELDSIDSGTADSVMTTRQRISPSQVIDFGEDLQKSGSVFRGLSLGTNQGMRLQSGLRLQLSGYILPKVEVIASLTDQNIPIQPEGNTQTLQEIDKVFIKINAPGLGATLGDYVFESRGSQFGSYTKKLQGIMGTAEFSSGSVTLFAAASKGEFTTNQFSGTEGNQGPYQLTGKQGQREIIVLAGTERIWIDGERMVRGEENDYIIEYGNGQITFTRNRLVTEDSRITVDFEYSSQDYQREMYGTVGESNLFRNRLRIQTSFFRDSDDKNNPLDLNLTDAYKEILSQAGDNPDSAVVSGATYVGSQKGSYIQADSAGFTYYDYVGLGNGDYTVRFSYVGSGNGDYSFVGYGIYQFQGQGKGDYLPIFYLPLASRHQMADVSASLKLGSGFTVSGEVGVSERDLNLFSGLDDDDNVDMAFHGRIHLDTTKVRLFSKSLGKLGLTAQLRSVGEKFRSVGRMTEIEYGRKWGNNEQRYWGQTLQEYKAIYQPISAWTIKGEMGSLKQESRFFSQRRWISTQLKPKKGSRVQYQAELIDTDEIDSTGSWFRHRGDAAVTIWGLTPTVNYLGEDRKTEANDSVQTGFRFDEWTGRIGFKKGLLSGEVSRSIRDDRKYQLNQITPYSQAQTNRIQCQFQWSQNWMTSIMFTRRNRDYSDLNLEDQKTHLADIKTRLSDKKRFIEGSLFYRFSSTQVSEMVRDTIHVGEGLGNYRFDEILNELVPDPDGDILIRFIQTGDFMPVNDLKLGSEFRLDGSRKWQESEKGFAGILKYCRTNTLVRIERQDMERGFGRVNKAAFFPSWGEDTTVVKGLISYHQDVEYRNPKSGFSLRLRFRQDDSENHQLSQESLVRHSQVEGIRMKMIPWKRTGILFEYEHQNESKTYLTGTTSDRDIKSHNWTLDFSYRPKQQIEFAVKLKIRLARDENLDPFTRAASVFILPRFSYSFRSRGHLRAELEWGDVNAEPEDRILPYEMLRGDQPGRTWRWTILMMYRISGHVQATLNYRGRQEPWREGLYQTGQMEVRAFF